jgi:hypothetical protein
MLFGIASVSPAAAVGTPLTVTNHDFESPGFFTCWIDIGDVRRCNTQPATPGWTKVSGAALVRGVFDATAITTHYPHLPGTQDGPFAAYFRDGQTNTRLAQVLSDPLQPNTEYTLTIAMGHRIARPDAPGSIELWAGGVKLATAGVAGDTSDVAGDLTDGTFTDVSLVYTTGATHAQLGQPLEIRFGPDGDGLIDFDNVRLDAVALSPEAQIADLGGDVQALLDSGALDAGQAVDLQLKLDAATDKLDQGKPDKAIKKLNDFIKLVNQWLKDGEVDSGVAAGLIDAAQAVIDTI